jgi:L-cystine transport system substrate-binding protein
MSGIHHNVGEVGYMKTLNFFVFAVALLLGVSILTSCSKKDDNGSSNDAKETIAKIRIGTGFGYKPFCYLDDDGNLQGYDIEVLKAVDELLPQYEFVFETYDFNNTLLALDAGRIEIAAYQYEKNPSREQNYTYADESYLVEIQYITVKKDNNDIKTLDDLAASGKKVFAPAATSRVFFDSYNSEHPDKPIVYDDGNGNITLEEIYGGLISGKWIAESDSKSGVDRLNAAFGNGLKIVGDPIFTYTTYFVYKKGNTELQQDVDGALKILKESGKLSEISIKILGVDLTGVNK